MSFSQSTVTEVFPPRIWGGQVAIAWTSSSPAGTWFQLYLDHALAWWGQRSTVRLPIPQSGAGPIRVDIGTVAPGEEQTSFAGSLPAAPQRRVELSWLGGAFLASDIAGFRVFGSDTAGGAIDYSIKLADITAYPGGVLTDGYGLGGYGTGGYGEVAGTYTWISNPLLTGTWSYGVEPYDSAGNVGSAVTTSQAIAVPPAEPGLFTDNTRLHYTYSSGTDKATLTWVATTG
jgi:hypothetical protein